MKSLGIWADLLRQRFVKACCRLGDQSERHALDLSRISSVELGAQQDIF